VDKESFKAAISKTRLENIASGKTVIIGHPHTEETKHHLSEQAIASGRSAGENNPTYGKKRSVESREKQSKTRTDRMVNGEYDFSTWTQGGYIESKKAGKTIFCRSSWELKFVQTIEEDETAISLQIEPFSVPYRLNGDARRYVPDFLVTYVDGRKVLIEIKPECYLAAQINVAKFAAAKEYCALNGLEFEVWTQEDLGIKK
jgi:hypothetical protein